MNIIYKRLFNLKIAHDYYKDGNARGMMIEPAASTLALLNNGKMLFKIIPGGAAVLYSAGDDEVTPTVNLGKALKLTFCLKVSDQSEFFNITNLDESASRKFGSSNILYFRNDPANASTDATHPEALTHTIINSLRDELFSYEFELATGPVDVLIQVTDENGVLTSIGKDADSNPLPAVLSITKGTDGVYRQQVDLRGKAGGKYTITIRDTGDTTTLKQEVVYADATLAPQPLLGIVDIVYEASTDHMYGNKEEYQLKFNRKGTLWKYFIADKNRKVDLVANDLFIKDTGTGGAPYNIYTFTREGAEPHADIRVNDMDTVVFKSDVPIPFFEVPKLNLELRKNPGDKQVIAHLPNPSHRGVIKFDLGNPASEIYVFI